MGRHIILVVANAIISLSNATIYMSPEQDILLPPSSSAANPLTLLGANSPYFAGPDVNGIENMVPENCYVEKVAYVVRHGSRYPDTSAYNQWVALYNKIQAATFTATHELAFLHSWKPVLTNPTLQIAQESPTGWKEAFDLGYRLRTKYPDLYTEGTPFISWANLYPRVVQTAQNFVRGFLGNNAATLGSVVTVNSTGSPLALFDSLSPSDLCPNFKDGNGGTPATTWESLYLPPITARFNALLSGSLTLTDSDVSLFPYLCGFESQITGILSPFCSTFTDSELESYEYRQDLRYYYGTGPGVDLPSKMMLPFLNSLVGLLAQGPGIQGKLKNGTTFALPSILTAFLNDGQISELSAATGVFDDQAPLDGSSLDPNRKYVSSHFVNMRGTIAFECLRCNTSSTPESSSTLSTLTTSTTTASVCSATTTSPMDCNHNNCLRQFLQSTAEVSSFCATYTASVQPTSKSLPPAVSQCSNSPSRISSACSCVVPATATPSCATSTLTSATAAPTASPTQTPGSTYLRILLNDAVYPVPSCKDGPGQSCLLRDYVDIVKSKLENVGDLKERCNVTIAGTPTTLLGAGFFTNLADVWVDTVGV